MHLHGYGLVAAWIMPLAFAGPRGNAFYRRTGEDSTSNDGTPLAASTSSATSVPPTSSSLALPSKDQFSSSSSKDEQSGTGSLPAGTSFTSSSNDKGTLSTLSSSVDTSSSSVPAKDQTSGSSASTEELPSSTSAGLSIVTQSTSATLTIGLTQPSMIPSFPYGTGVSPSPGSTVDVFTTDVVYTTLTTCPVTSTVVSGTSSIQEVTTTISTVTRTSISTICTKCVAPPKSSSVITPLTQPSAGLSTSSNTSGTAPFSAGTSPVPTLASSLTQPSAGLPKVSSRPEISYLGTAAPPSNGLGFPTAVSLTVSATLGATDSLVIPGYSVVPSPPSLSGAKSPFYNATSSIIPVFTPSLLGNGYGGGFVSTPSIYVTKLLFPNGPSEGVPPGYGFSSKPETSAGTSLGSQNAVTRFENSTSISTGLGLPTKSTFNFGNTTQTVGSPLETPTLLPITYGVTNTSLGASNAPTAFITNIPTSGVVTVETKTPLPVLITSTASSGQVIVKTSSALPSLVSSTATSGQVVVETSTPSPVLVSSTASSGQVIVETSTPASGLIESTASNGAAVGSSIPVILITSTAPNGEVTVEASPLSSALVSSITSMASGAVPVVVSHLASSGEVIIATSTPPQVLVSNTASSGEIIVATSSPSPIIVSSTASSGEVIVETSSTTSGTTEFGGSPILSTNGTPIEIGALGSPTSFPGQFAGAPITLPAGSSVEQESASGLPMPTILTPVIGANGLTSLAVVSTPQAQVSSAGQPAATVLTPIAGANGLTSFAVIPSPIVGANGLTSLAVFSTPVAAANGLTSPAVILTPVVGANGMTSLAVLATPVIGANGQTSLAIGFEGQQGPSGTMSPTEEFFLATSPSTGLAGQSEASTSIIVFPTGASGPIASSGSPAQSTGGGSNSTVHVSLNPSAIGQFEGSGLKRSFDFGVGLVSFIAFLFLL